MKPDNDRAANAKSAGAPADKPFSFSVSARRLTPAQIVNMFDQAGRRSQLVSVFGFLDESPLNGGRPRADSVPFPLTEIEKLNDMGIGYSFTLTNTAVAQEHLKDAHTNELLRRFERPINSVIVATDLVADYVREHYPAYKIRASCLCNFTTAEQINAACGRFDMVTPWPELNASDEFLGQLKYKDQIMLFGSQACLGGCVENRLRHYFLASLDHIMFYNHRQYCTSYHPEDFEWTFPPFCRGKDAPILLEDLDRCRRLGFTNIKVVHPAQFAAYYLGIQPKPVGKIASFVRSRIPGRNPSVEVRPVAKKS